MDTKISFDTEKETNQQETMRKFNLPTIKSPALRKSPKMIVLYGPPKIGKTTLCSELKDCLIFDLENGTDFLSCLNIKINNYTDYKDACQRIQQADKPYKYIAIDPVDVLEIYAERLAKIAYKASPAGKNFNGDSILELPMGGGYRWMWNEFHVLLAHVTKACDNIILIGHLRDKMIEIAGKEVSAKDLELTGKLRSIVCSAADAVGCLYRDPKDSSIIRVSFNSKETVICGSRCEHLKGQDFPFDWSKIYVD